MQLAYHRGRMDSSEIDHERALCQGHNGSLLPVCPVNKPREHVILKESTPGRTKAVEWTYRLFGPIISIELILFQPRLDDGIMRLHDRFLHLLGELLYSGELG